MPNFINKENILKLVIFIFKITVNIITAIITVSFEIISVISMFMLEALAYESSEEESNHQVDETFVLNEDNEIVDDIYDMYVFDLQDPTKPIKRQ